MTSSPKSRGQSLVEILIGVAIGAIFIVGAAAVIAPALKTNTQVLAIQAKTQAANEMMDNIRAWAAGNWGIVLSLATGTANTYYLNTSQSPFVAVVSSSYVTSTASFAVVQNASSARETFTTTTSFSATFPSSPSTGDLILLSLNYGGNPSAPTFSCSDPVNGQYSVSSNYFTSSISQGGALLYKPNITSFGGTVTCTFSPYSNYLGLGVTEYSGAATSSPLDATSSNSGATTGLLTTGTSTTNLPGELIFTSVMDLGSGSDTYTGGTGFTIRLNTAGPGSNHSGIAHEDLTQSSPGPVSGSISITTTTTWTAALATFKPAVLSTPTGTATGGYTESVTIGSSTVKLVRYFYLSDVYRDSNGNVTTTASGNAYDPSTKQVNIVVNTVSSTTATTTYTMYIARNTDNLFAQSNWAGGSGQTNAVKLVDNKFATSTNIAAGANLTISGLSPGGVNFANGENATSVIGATGYGGVGGATNSSSLYYPYGITYDTSNARLFVADSLNNRIMIFNIAPSTFVNGESASSVLGQSTFTTQVGSSSQSGMSGPWGLAYDASNTRLFVADGANNRVTVFNVATNTLVNGENASSVLGPSTFTSGYLGPSQSAFGPSGIAYDPVNRRLFVSDWGNNRILMFNVAPGFANGENASSVIGQSSYSGYAHATTQGGLYYPYGLAYDTSNTRLFVADKSNNRVMMFNVPLGFASTSLNASAVIGQTNYTSSTATTTQSGFYTPYDVAYDASNTRLFVADEYNNRTLVFSVPPGFASTGLAATTVLGQQNFQSSNLGPTINTERYPYGVGYDSVNTRLFVGQGPGADYIAVYSPFSSAATGTLDSETFDTGIANGAQLNSIVWQGTLTAGTAVYFQIAVSNSSSGPWSFEGSDGTSNTWFTGNPGTVIKLVSNPLTLGGYNLFSGYRYYRYRVELQSDANQLNTPTVSSAVVYWSP